MLWQVCITYTAYCDNFFEKIVNQQSHLWLFLSQNAEKQYYSQPKSRSIASY